MITFNYQTNFELRNQPRIEEWITRTVNAEGCELETINYVFCTDEYLYNLNVEYLDHDTLTDIITFDYSVGKRLQGEIYISIDRVRENAQDFKQGFETELHRVIIHGVLHLCGYKDKTEEETEVMRGKEDHYIKAL